MSHFLRKLSLINVKCAAARHDAQILFASSRNISIVPTQYEGEPDPAPKFFSTDVQTILKRLTRPDFAKVFRKRTNSGLPVLRTPKYKFLTNEELEAEVAKAHERADRLLQMPPVLKVHKPIEEILSKDPALTGYDRATYLFTDISFGVNNEHRFIVERDPDGTLRSCDHDVRKRLNQVYFPMVGRKIREPIMFTDEARLHSLLDQQKYEFVLDRACIQYEPDEPGYHRITSTTYQHVDQKRGYDLLRSTRHFGPLAFYLSWQRGCSGLLLELLQGGAAREAVLLLALRRLLHADVQVEGELVQQILSSPIQLTRPNSLTEEDIQLDTKCIECLEKYINNNSSMKSQHELALQGYREAYQQLIDLSRGLRKAHGNA